MEQLIKNIYAGELVKFTESKHLYDGKFKGWAVIHYLVECEWYEALDYYLHNGGNINILTDDFVINSSHSQYFIIGGRSALFNCSNDEMINYLLKNNITIDVDNNGLDYKTAKIIDKNIVEYKKNYLLVVNRINKIYITNIGTEKFQYKSITNIDTDIKDYEMSDEVAIEFSKFNDFDDTIKNANSMHYTSYPINVNNINIKKLIKTIILQEFNDNIKITNISGFIINYNEKNEKELKEHMDDSLYTINLCINESDSGAELHFTSNNILVKQKSNHVYFHKGSEKHRVLPLIKGEKKNIIIWIR